MQVREEKGIRPGGFGLLMVRQTADELLYNEKRNEVVFVKYLDETTPRRRAIPQSLRPAVDAGLRPAVSLSAPPRSRC